MSNLTSIAEAGLSPAAIFETESEHWWLDLVALHRAEARYAADGPSGAVALVNAAQILEGEPDRSTDAISLYEEAHALDGSAREPIFALARMARRIGDPTAERRWLEAALELCTTEEKVERLGLLARLAALLQDALNAPAEARAVLLEAVQLDPDDRTLILRLQLLITEDDMESRRWVLRQTLRLSESTGHRGRLLLEEAYLAEDAGEVSTALVHYQAALKADPSLEPALEGLIRGHCQLGQWEVLIVALQQASSAVEDDQARGRLLYLCALLNATRTQGDQGRLYVGQAAMLLANDPVALRELVVEYEQLEMWGPANTLLESLARANTGTIAAGLWYRVGLNAERNLGGDQDAFKAYQRAIEADARHLPTLSALRRHTWATGHLKAYARAVGELAVAAEEVEVRAALHLHAGDVHEMLIGNSANALAHYAVAVESDFAGSVGRREMSMALVERYRVLSRDGAWPTLISELETVVKASPAPTALACVQDWLAELYERQPDRVEDAIRLNRTILEGDPDNERARRSLLRLLEGSGERAGFLESLKQACVRARPLRALALRDRIAKLETAMGDFKAAEATWRISLGKHATYLPAIRGLGRLYSDRERWGDLADLYRHQITHVESEAAHVGLLGRLGELLEGHGETTEAISVYELLLALAPDAPQPRSALEGLYTRDGRWPQLAALLRAQAERVESPSHQAAILLRLARVLHVYGGKEDEVEATYRAALAVCPDAWPAEWGLERLLLEQEGRDEALLALYEDLAEGCGSAAQETLILHKRLLLADEELVAELLTEGSKTPSIDEQLRWLELAAAKSDHTEMSKRLSALAELASARCDRIALLTEAAECGQTAQVDPATLKTIWEQLLTLAPHTSRAWAGLLELTQGAEREALWLRFAEVTKDERGRSVALWQAALAQLETDPESGQALLAKASELAVDPVPGWILLEAFGVESSDADQVSSLLERAEQSEPLAASRLLFKAGILRQTRLDDPEGARDLLVEATRLDPQSDEIFDAAALCLGRMGDNAGLARMMHHRAARLTDKRTLVMLLRRLAHLESGLGNRDKAFEIWSRLLDIRVDDCEAHEFMADHLYTSERFADSIGHYERVLTQLTDAEKKARILVRLGRIRAYHVNDKAGAIQALRSAVGTHDPHGHALEALAAVYLISDEADLAQLAYQRLERIVTDEVRISAARAGQVRALLASGRRMEAAERLRVYRDADPVDPVLATLARDIGPVSEPAIEEDEDEFLSMDSAELEEIIEEEEATLLGEPLLADDPSLGEPFLGEESLLDEAPNLAERLLADEPLLASEPSIADLLADEPLLANDPSLAEPLLANDPSLAEPFLAEPLLANDPSLAESFLKAPLLANDPSLADDPLVAAIEDIADSVNEENEVQIGDSLSPFSLAGQSTEQVFADQIVGEEVVDRPLRKRTTPPPPPPAKSISPMPELPRVMTQPGTPVPLVGPNAPLILDPVAEMDDFLGFTMSVDFADESTAAQKARAGIAADPLDLDAWKALKSTIASTSSGRNKWLDDVISWISGSVLWGRVSNPSGQIPLALQEELYPEIVPSVVAKMLRLIGPGVISTLSVEEGKGTPIGSDTPVLFQAQRVTFLGKVPPVDLLLNKARRYAAEVYCGTRCQVVLGHILVEVANSRGGMFLLTRCLGPIWSGTLCAWQLSDREFRAFLAALCSVLGAAPLVRARDRSLYEQYFSRLRPLLLNVPQAWKTLAEQSVQAIEDVGTNELRGGLEHYNTRLALAVADGFGAAVEMFRLLDFDDRPREKLSQAELKQLLTDSDLLRDLLIFAGSSECLAIRDWLSGGARGA